MTAPDSRRERARALRRQGLSRRQISERLGVPNTSTLGDWLKGIDPPGWTKRPNAKDELRDRARRLRAEGRTYPEIVAALGVSKSSVSLCVRYASVPRAGRDAGSRPVRREAADLSSSAVAMRLQGCTRKEIQRALAVSSDRLTQLLAGTPPVEWRTRPRGAGHLRDQARRLRREGKSYPAIGDELGVASSSVASWCQGVDATAARRADRLTRSESRRRTLSRRAWQRAESKLVAARELPHMTRRDLIVAAVVAYWCEGAKDKPHARREQLIFCNSDPRLIKLWLRFLDTLGVAPERRRLRLQIHESADAEAALRHWAAITGAELSAFSKTTLKRHSPVTHRRNAGSHYRGCLTVSVTQSAELYRGIEGWFVAICSGIQRLALDAAAEEAVGHWTARKIKLSEQSAVG